MANIQDPWVMAQDRYLETLTPEEKDLFTYASLENLFYKASVTQKIYEDESKSRALSKKLKPVLDAISGYGAALDVYSNASSGILCPLWGSIRVLLHIASEFDKYFEKLINMFAAIGNVLPTFQVYKRLFAGHHFLIQALSEVYLDIIEFCISAKQVFDQLRQKKGSLVIQLKFLWKPFDKKFEDILDKFHSHRTSVERQARLSHMIEGAGERGAQSEERKQTQLQRSAEDAMQRKLRRISVLKQISTIDHEYRHRQLRKKRYKNTGNWIFSTKQFMEWIGKTGSCCLWCHGIPGCGKTIITTTVVEALLSGSVLKTPVVIYFYCDYSDQKTIDVLEILGSLIKQLLSRIEIPDRIGLMVSTFYQSGTRKPDADELLKIVLEVLEEFDEVFFILDGIDECAGNDRVELLAAIQSILQTGTGTKIAKFFIASRADVDLRKNFARYIALPISIADTTIDIIPFVNGIVREKIRSQELVVRDPSLIEKIIDALAKGAKGMFLWVTFQIADICEETCDDGIKRTLARLPPDLAATYARALQKIHKRNQTSGLTQKIFKWMVCARRPLSIGELKEAISISPLDKYLERDRVATDDSKIIKICANLAVLDSEEGTVRFAHYSVQEFLLSGPVDDVTDIHFRLSDADLEIGEICITYLSFRSFETQLSKEKPKIKTDFSLLTSPFLLRESYFGRLTGFFYGGLARFRGSMTTSQPLYINWDEYSTHRQVPLSQTLGQQYLLLGYVIDNWTSHMVALSDTNPRLWSMFKFLTFEQNLCFPFRPWEQINTTKDLPHMPLVLWALQAGNEAFLKLLLQPPQGPSLYHYLVRETTEDRSPLVVEALYQSAKKGHAKLVQLLLELGIEHKWNADVLRLNSLLTIAVQNNHDVIAKLLLESGADKSVRNEIGDTPLHWAAQHGSDGVAKVLLESGADKSVRNEIGDTPLHWAAKHGSGGVAKVLLESGADKNAKNESGNTPLHWAAGHGSGGVAKLLLESGADKNAKNGCGSTPLHGAAQHGSDGVAKLLLESGADKNAKNGKGYTPLHMATQHESDGMAKLLLESGADKNVKDMGGHTPLRLAAAYGSDMVTKLLLESGAETDAEGESGDTPLHWAAQHGSDGVAKLLLESGADTNAKNKSGNTPLHRAAQYGSGGVVKLLLESGADKNVKDMGGHTPLHWTAKHGSDGVAKLLLETGADTNAKNESGNTPLHRAAQYGSDGVAKLLLESGADKNVKDMGGHTPLHWTAKHRSGGVAKLLLESGADTNAKNRFGITPLHWTGKHGSGGVAKLLLESGADKNVKDMGGHTPLHWTAKHGSGGVAKLLLESGADTNAKNRFGITPLHWMAKHRSGGVAKLLLESGADTNEKNESGNTPLHRAAQYGSDGVAKLLLESGADKNAKDMGGDTPLHRAAKHGSGGVAKLLLESGADTNAKNESGNTPLHWAAQYGSDGVAKLLLESGADKNAKDMGGDTPLHWAAKHGSGGVAKLLLESGSDINAKNEIGDTPLRSAVLSSSDRVAELLRESGADEDVESYLRGARFISQQSRRECFFLGN